MPLSKAPIHRNKSRWGEAEKQLVLEARRDNETYGKEKIGSYTDHDHHRHSSQKENVARASFSYDFHIGGFGVAPTIAFDFVDGETATVFGVAFIKAF